MSPGCPVVEEEVEDPEELRIARERVLLRDGHRIHGCGGAARELGEVEEVDLEHGADLLQPREREGLLREQALHARLREAEGVRQRAVGRAARLEQLLQGLDQARGLRCGVHQRLLVYTRVLAFDTTTSRSCDPSHAAARARARRVGPPQAVCGIVPVPRNEDPCHEPPAHPDRRARRGARRFRSPGTGLPQPPPRDPGRAVLGRGSHRYDRAHARRAHPAQPRPGGRRGERRWRGGHDRQQQGDAGRARRLHDRDRPYRHACACAPGPGPERRLRERLRSDRDGRDQSRSDRLEARLSREGP